VGQTLLEGKCKLQILQPASQFAIKPNYSTSLTSTTCKMQILQQIANFTTSQPIFVLQKEIDH